MRRVRVALAQVNLAVGDISGNALKIVAWTSRAREAGADIVAFPELAITGYPPEDLLLRASFVRDNLAALDRIAGETTGITSIVGFVDEEGGLYNAAAVLADGRVAARYHKQLLPNYGVFDEARYFKRGTGAPVFDIAGARVGVNVCEDIWFPDGPTQAQAAAAAEVIININGSPYHRGKGAQRERLIATRASENNVPVCYVNMIGGQDELVFDGHSIVCGATGALVARGTQFAEELLLVDVDLDAGTVEATAAGLATPLEPDAEVWGALVLGVRDYFAKTGFGTAVIGLSGGIDSTLVACVAVDALGPEHVVGVSMPSRYSSEHSKTDAEDLATRLGIRYLTIPIEPAFEATLDMLGEAFADTQMGLAEENLQARIRGNLLMSLANKFGWLVLTTGNKSEMATGYSTLYGDMAGGFAVIKDVPKTLVYDLARYVNASAGSERIPLSVIEKPPSAELRFDQLDTDSLPPYEVLDPILQMYVEQDRGIEEIVAVGYDSAVVSRVVAMVDRNEYKRRQAPPGIKITERAFGRDRRLPIANGYRPK